MRIDNLSQAYPNFLSEKTVYEKKCQQYEEKCRQVENSVNKLRGNITPEKMALFDENWDRFKSRTFAVLEVTKALKEGQEEKAILENLSAEITDIEAIWEKYKGEESKTFFGELLAPIKDSMAGLEKPRVTLPPPLPPRAPPQTEAQQAVAQSLIQREQDKQVRIQGIINRLPEQSPHLSKTIGFLAQHLADETYGPKMKEGVQHSDPAVCWGRPLLKLILLQSCSKEFTGRFNTLEWEFPPGFEEQHSRLREFLKEFSDSDMPDLLKDVFLKESPGTVDGKKLDGLLTDAIKTTTISNEQELAYVKMLESRIKSYDAYENLFVDLDRDQPSFLEAADTLIDMMYTPKSESPRQFLKAANLALQYLMLAEDLEMGSSVGEGAMEESTSGPEPESLDEERNRAMDISPQGDMIQDAPSPVSMDVISENAGIEEAGEEFVYESCDEEDELSADSEDEGNVYAQKADTIAGMIMEAFADDITGELVDSYSDKDLKYLSDYLKTTYLPSSGEDITDADQMRVLCLWFPSALKTAPQEYEEHIDQILTFAKKPDNGCVIPMAVFYAVMNYDPKKALEMHPYIPLQDQAVAMHQLQGKIEGLEDQCFLYAENRIKGLLIDYLLSSQSQENAEKVKRDIFHLLSHLKMDEEAEARLLLDIVQSNHVDRALAVTLIPELARIGKKQEALEIVKEEISRITQSQEGNIDPYFERLTHALLKASHLTVGGLKNKSLGTILPVADETLDLDFIDCLKDLAKADLQVSNPSAQVSIDILNDHIERKNISLLWIVTLFQTLEDEVHKDVISIYRTQIKRAQIKLKEQRLQMIPTTERDKKIICYKELFFDCLAVGDVEKGIGYAQEALALNPSATRDRSGGSLKGLLIKILDVAQGALQITDPDSTFRSVIESLIWEICDKIENPVDRIKLTIDQFNRFDFCTQGSKGVLQSLVPRISNLTNTWDQQACLIELIVKLENRIPQEVQDSAIRSLNTLQQVLVNNLKSIAGLNYVRGCWKVAHGFGLLGQINSMLIYTKSARDGIQARLGELQGELFDIRARFIRLVKYMHSKGLQSDEENYRKLLSELLEMTRVILNPGRRIPELIGFLSFLGFNDPIALEFVKDALRQAFIELTDPEIWTNKYFKRQQLNNLLVEARSIEPELATQVSAAIDENEFDLTLEGIILRRASPKENRDWCIELIREAKGNANRISKILQAVHDQLFTEMGTPEEKLEFLQAINPLVPDTAVHKAWIEQVIHSLQDRPPEEGGPPRKRGKA